MADITPLTPRPQVRSSSKPIGYDAAARQVDTGASIRRAPDADLMGLLDGLQAFNPALEKFGTAARIREETQLREDVRKAEDAGTADAARDKSGLPLDLNPAPDAGFEGTLKSVHANAYRRGIVERAALAGRAATLAEYGEKRDLPDFNVDKFIANQRATQLQGLDNDMAASMAPHLERLEAGIRQDYDGVRLKRLDEARESSISATLRNSLTADEPGTVVQRYFSEVLPVVRGLGKTNKEGAAYLVGHLVNLSNKAGGLPELFDSVLTEKDPASGLTLFDMNPQLQAKIESAKHSATALRDKAVEDGASDGNLLWLKDFGDRVRTKPEGIEFDELVANFGKHGAFKSDNEVIAAWNQVLKARGDNAQQTNLLGLARDGKLFIASEKDQKSVMGSLTGTVVEGLSKAISDNNTGGVAVLANALIDAHRAAGSNMPSEPIKRMFEFIGQAAPGKDGGRQSPLFGAASEVYRALAGKPELRNVYFDEDGRKVMDSYLRAVQGGAEPEQAFKAAYAAVSPEAKAREEAFRRTPEFTEKLTKAAKWATGSSFWPRILGGNGRPDNGGFLVGEAQTWATDYVRRNPSASDSDVQSATEAHIASAFVLDKTTGNAVRVPTGEAPEATQAAVTAFTAKWKKDLKLDDRESGWSISMIPDNIEQGSYRVSTSFNGAPVHFIEQVSMKDVVAQHRRDTMFLPEDAAVLQGAKVAFATGKAYSDPRLQEVVAKARSLGVQPDVVKQIDEEQMKHARDTLKALPRIAGEVDTSSLYRNDRIQNSPKITAQTSQRFLNSANGGSTGLAASLITLGEGVVYKAYDDPAKDAGKNIGTGYNLKANAAVAERDLRAAGVPSERIPHVIAGTEPLSPEQSDRLTLIAVGRYEQLAQGQVDGNQPGLWGRLQPQQRAVLTDIAYQTGNVGQFKKALSSLLSGDQAAFQEQSKVFYTNRSGERVEDKRRNALRNAMLSGTSYWQSVLQRSLGTPGTQLDAVELASK